MKIKIVALIAIAAIVMLVMMKAWVIIMPCKANNSNIGNNNSIININQGSSNKKVVQIKILNLWHQGMKIFLLSLCSSQFKSIFLNTFA